MSLNYNRILNWPFEDVIQNYSQRDSIIYALSLGLGVNATDRNELKFVYEKGLETFPTMAVVMGHPAGCDQYRANALAVLVVVRQQGRQHHPSA